MERERSARGAREERERSVRGARAFEKQAEDDRHLSPEARDVGEVDHEEHRRAKVEQVDILKHPLE